MKRKYISKFSDISLDDIDKVGGKCISWGMINNLSALGGNVPDGFATVSEAYKLFIESNNIDDKIQKILNELDLDSIKDLANAGKAIRRLISKQLFRRSLRSKFFKLTTI